MIDEKTLREFMEKHYPAYKDNLSLARILYAKHVGSLVGTVPSVSSAELKDYEGLVVRMRGVLAAVDVMEYQACPKCMFSVRKCRCQSSSEPVTRYAYYMTFGDNSGIFKVLAWKETSGIWSENDVGREAEITGIVFRSDDDELLVRARSIVFIESKAPSKLDEVLSFLKEARRVRKNVVENLLRMNGLKLEEVEKYLREEGDYYVWEGERG
ncbi:MAG: hypothetical protein QXN77_07845 [Candidatus Caldarchaeum sp.]